MSSDSAHSRYRHIVLFRLHVGVSAEVRAEAIARLRASEIVDQMTSAHVAVSADRRKGEMLVLDSTFDDEAAFRAYQEGAAHADLGRFMSEISDWWIGDYETSTSLADRDWSAA